MPYRLATLVAVTVLLAAFGTASASAADYVAMGDSYSSGTGTRTYFDTGCERSHAAYPDLIKSSFGSSFSFVACGGAKTQDVLNNQVSSLSTATKYATISIGGNDAGFSSVITKCAQPFVSCDGEIDTAQAFITNTLPGRLDTLYAQIKSRAPNAVVAVVGYPRLFNGTDCNALTFFSAGEMTRLNQTADMLASVTRGRAQLRDFTFVDARAAFRGHAVCDNPEWLNGLSNPTSESYHPNTTGHSSGYAPIVRAALQAAPKPGAPDGGNGRIAFTSTRSGNGDIWVMNNNGQFPLNLTAAAGEDVDPVWSPDGTELAFSSNRDGDNEIYVMNGDGTGLTRLTSNTSDDRDPTWSPNGDYIAFKTDRTGNNEIFRMTATGASQTNLTNNSASDFGPDWSPDGSEIVFQRFTSGTATGNGNEVFKMNADGQGQTNLTNTAASVNDGSPAWSPDGNTIAFHSNRDGDFEIDTMPQGGGGVTQRTSNTASDGEPAYSPRGDLLTFHSNRDGANNDIFTMTSGGGSQTNRTANAAADTSPNWQADSTPPLTSITSGPSGPVASARPAFTLASSEPGSTFECRVDSGAFQPCAASYQPPALADGPHTISVRSLDAATPPNTDPNPVVRAFRVDTTPPQISAQCPSAPVLLNATATATVDASDGGSGIAADENPTGGYELDTTYAGVHVFQMDAVDLAGNRASAQCAYEVDYAAPGAPAVHQGGNPNTGAFTLGWEPAAPAEYALRYELQRRDADDADWQPAMRDIPASEWAFTGSEAPAEGTWTYRVRGSDGMLDTPWSDTSGPVKVDRTGPTAPSLVPDRAPDHAGGGGWFRDTVTISTEEHGDPSLPDGSDGTGVDPESVPAARTVERTGTVRARLRDRLGNPGDEAALSVQVDADAPDVHVDCPSSVELGADAEADVTASDADSGLADDPSGTVPLDTTAVGPQELVRTARDNVGHERTARCAYEVTYPAPGTPEVRSGGNPNGGTFTIGWAAAAPAQYGLRYVVERRDADDDQWHQVASGLDALEHAFARGDVADEGTWTYRVKGDDGRFETPWSTASDAVKVDQSAPAQPELAADRAPDHAGDGGWFKDTVTVTASDQGDPALRDGSAGSGVDGASVPAPQVLDHSATARATVRDRVGNESAETALGVQVDATPPSLLLDCPTSVILGGTGTVTVTASDDESGLAHDPTGTIAVDTSTAGIQEYERSATDNVGHHRTVRCEVQVAYVYGGLLQPVNPDGSSIFKLGSTVPLKVRLSDAAGRSVPGVYGEVQLERTSTGIDGTVVEEVVSATPTNGKVFEYDPGSELYRFNLSTKPLSKGTWRIRITLDDGSVHRTQISLR